MGRSCYVLVRVAFPSCFVCFLLLEASSLVLTIGGCIGILWMMYVNTGTRKEGEKSAYSLFNENFEAFVSQLLYYCHASVNVCGLALMERQAWRILIVN